VSSENVQHVRDGYEAWNRGEIGRAVALLDQQVEWHGHPELPAAGPFVNRQDVERWLAEFRDVWEELRAEPLVFIDAGDDVVALVRVSGRGRGSGATVQGGVDAHVWTWRDGRIVRVAIHQGAEVVLRDVSDAERELLRLRFVTGLGTAEIAHRLRVSEAEAEQRIERAMRRLGAVPAS
jgi:ketosteroid isomerase-like protein